MSRKDFQFQSHLSRVKTRKFLERKEKKWKQSYNPRQTDNLLVTSQSTIKSSEGDEFRKKNQKKLTSNESD